MRDRGLWTRILLLCCRTWHLADLVNCAPLENCMCDLKIGPRTLAEPYTPPSHWMISLTHTSVWPSVHKLTWSPNGAKTKTQPYVSSPVMKLSLRVFFVFVSANGISAAPLPLRLSRGALELPRGSFPPDRSPIWPSPIPRPRPPRSCHTWRSPHVRTSPTKNHQTTPPQLRRWNRGAEHRTARVPHAGHGFFPQMPWSDLGCFKRNHVTALTLPCKFSPHFRTVVMWESSTGFSDLARILLGMANPHTHFWALQEFPFQRNAIHLWSRPAIPAETPVDGWHQGTYEWSK